ncbi:hypothetical protein MKEN_00535600 [Mycena kentingensis (nom. inval.)]|nr:hypothetical protein MKEN_00535600 [Mycena kentingensis (nom. inval.)]
MTTTAYSSPSFKSQLSAASNRPILTSLNGDNSWLISFPVPANLRKNEPGSKAFYHVVSDAWLQGDTGFGWGLVCIEMPGKPKIRDGAGVGAVVREIESAVGDGTGAGVDAIFVNFHYDDHMHEGTLRTFDASIPVFATPQAAGTIHAWNHFSTVVTTKDFGVSATNEPWRAYHPGAPLPDWLSVFRIPGHSVLNFATAMVWSPTSEQHEAILYSPHGIRPSQPPLRALIDLISNPSTNFSILAILHGLKTSYAFGIQTTLGVENGIALTRHKPALLDQYAQHGVEVLGAGHVDGAREGLFLHS